MFHIKPLTAMPRSATTRLFAATCALLLTALPVRAQLAGTPEAHDFFGTAVAAGDFNGDGYRDLAIGVPGQEVGTVIGTEGAGSVHVVYGTAAGLTSDGDQYWTQDSDGIAGAAETNDLFGEALAAGDFNGDGFDDLVIGVRWEDIGTVEEAGAVHVIYGSRSPAISSGTRTRRASPTRPKRRTSSAPPWRRAT